MSNMPTPSQEEEEYFAKVEIEKRKALAQKLHAAMQDEEVESLKKLHWKHCANCGFEMHPVVFKGITVDKCPHCNAVFLKPEVLEQLSGEESGFVTSVLSLFKF